MKDKKVVFMGTPEFSVPVLEMLIEKTEKIKDKAREFLKILH